VLAAWRLLQNTILEAWSKCIPPTREDFFYKTERKAKCWHGQTSRQVEATK